MSKSQKAESHQVGDSSGKWAMKAKSQGRREQGEQEGQSKERESGRKEWEVGDESQN